MKSRGGALGTAVMAAVLLAACGTDTQTSQTSTSTERGTLVQDPPPRMAYLAAADFASLLSASPGGPGLLQLAGQPVCGVDIYYLTYWTVGGAGEAASATAALMVPSGSAPQCAGPRPIVLYGHGTTSDKNYNIADISNTANSANSEGVLLAAEFAAQGFIVVAPNYAGYDASSLAYHPFVNAAANAADMIDALKAARKALPDTFVPGTSHNGMVFVTGYSEGGYVAMATHKELEAHPVEGVQVVASAPMSGPYALAAFADSIFLGQVDIGSTLFAPLIARSYQSVYSNVYGAPLPALFEPAYSEVAGLLPSTTPLATLFTNNQLPQTALFSSTPPQTGNAQLDAALAVPANPLFASGFGPANLITNDYRLQYVGDALTNMDQVIASAVSGTAVGIAPAADPQFPLRQDLKKNDLRGFTPQAPVLLCGGNQDPTVFYSVNTGVKAAEWGQLVQAGAVLVLDVDSAPTSATDPFAPLKVGFQTELAGLVGADVGTPIADLSPAQQAGELQAYHSTVAPFCTTAARGFFEQILAQVQAAQQ